MGTREERRPAAPDAAFEAETYEALRAAPERRAPVEPDRLARLQDFGARLAAGDPELTGSLERIDPSEDPNRGNL